MRKELEFPRKYASSSAAYRAIRQFEEKYGTKDLVLEKIMKGEFKVTKLPSIEDFKTIHKNISYGDTTFRYYPDGVSGEGYYELKTGDRRRPNSEFIPVESVFTDFKNKVCK
jgi:hypothetical protein